MNFNVGDEALPISTFRAENKKSILAAHDVVQYNVFILPPGLSGITNGRSGKLFKNLILAEDGLFSTIGLGNR
jgi:hypothetical protein